MHALCTICGDIFTGIHPEVVHSTLCGHLFHYVCLDQWLQRSKTCPQCRSTVKERNTVKLYFQISTYQSTQDSGNLENELQNLKFKITLQNIDIKKLTEEKDLFKMQRNEIKSKLLKREEQIRNHETVVSSLHDQIKILKSQMKSLTEVQLRAEELQSKLEQYKSIDRILKASASEAAEHLERMKDKTDSSILCTCISTLKKEIDQYKKIEKDLKYHLKLTETKLLSAISEINKLQEQNSMINRCFLKLKDDYSIAEKEIENLKTKYRNHKELKNDEYNNLREETVHLSTSKRKNTLLDNSNTTTIDVYEEKDISSSSSDKICNLNELITKVDIHREKSTSPYSPNKLYNLNKLKNKSALTKRRLVTTSSNFGVQCYDGLGGHVKEEQALTDRAELIYAINKNKSSKSSSLNKRVKLNSKNNSQKSDLLKFYTKKS